MLRALVLGGLATLGTAGLLADEVVEIRMRGRYFSEPATVRIMVAVEPNSKNRALRVEADGDRLFRSSEVPLGGSDERRLHTVEFKNLPAGHYLVRAQVIAGNDDVRGAAEELLVVGDPGEPQ